MTLLRRWLFAFVGSVAFVVLLAGALLSGARPGAPAPSPSASPSPQLTVATATAAPTPTPGPTVGTLAKLRLWYSRADHGDSGLPPVAKETVVSYPYPASGSAEARIEALVLALSQARQSDIPLDAKNVFFLGTRAGQRTITVKAKVDGDLATVEIGGTPWGYVETDADVRGVIQQLVYTITEEPGIRRAKVTEPGKDHVLILTNRGLGGGSAWKDPLTREQVAGYRSSGTEMSSIVNDGDRTPMTVRSTKVTNEAIGGLGRFTVELGSAGGRMVPRLTAKLSEFDGKWLFRLDIPHAAAPNPKIPYEQFTSGPITSVDSPHTRGPEDIGAIFLLMLDDARPWRLTVEPASPNSTRINVDVGGRPEWVNRSIAVYALEPATGGGLTVRGAARVFEAGVSWRFRDTSGREVARGTSTASVGTSAVWGTFEARMQAPPDTGPGKLEVFWVSPRDGSEQDVIGIPLGVR